jgi:hypothetical protein
MEGMPVTQSLVIVSGGTTKVGGGSGGGPLVQKGNTWQGLPHPLKPLISFGRPTCARFSRSLSSDSEPNAHVWIEWRAVQPEQFCSIIEIKRAIVMKEVRRQFDLGGSSLATRI